MTLISIQSFLPGDDSSLGWASAKPVLHTAETNEEAVAVAYGISKQLGCVTVRMVRIPEAHLEAFTEASKEDQAAFIGRCSGTYIQSK